MLSVGIGNEVINKQHYFHHLVQSGCLILFISNIIMNKIILSLNNKEIFIYTFYYNESLPTE